MTGQVLLAAASAIVVLMGLTWLVSLAWKDASIVDPVWPFGFVVVAWVTRFVADGNDAQQWLLVAMVTLWGLRLSGYLAWRNAVRRRTTAIRRCGATGATTSGSSAC